MKQILLVFSLSIFKTFLSIKWFNVSLSLQFPQLYQFDILMFVFFFLGDHILVGTALNVSLEKIALPTF